MRILCDQTRPRIPPQQRNETHHTVTQCIARRSDQKTARCNTFPFHALRSRARMGQAFLHILSLLSSLYMACPALDYPLPAPFKHAHARHSSSSSLTRWDVSARKRRAGFKIAVRSGRRPRFRRRMRELLQPWAFCPSPCFSSLIPFWLLLRRRAARRPCSRLLLRGCVVPVVVVSWGFEGGADGKGLRGMGGGFVTFWKISPQMTKACALSSRFDIGTRLSFKTSSQTSRNTP